MQVCVQAEEPEEHTEAEVLEETDTITEETEQEPAEEIHEECGSSEETEVITEETAEGAGQPMNLDIHEPKIEGLFHYTDENGNEHSTDAHLIEFVEDCPNSLLDDGWYIITHDWTFNNRLVAVGDAKLILADGVTLTMNHGIRVEKGVGNLEIFAQSLDFEQAGKLYCGAYDGQAAIGGNEGMSNGRITIGSGIIEAYGGSDGAGIGAGNNAGNGEVEIRGGFVKAIGGNSWNGAGAGIGGGNHGGGGEIVISGGTIDAEGGNWAAGIGGGNSNYGGSNSNFGGKIIINGGNIYAKGNNGGAGIGGGSKGQSGSITINAGTIEAHGHLAIGHGKNSESSDDITLGDGVGMKGFNYEDRYDVLAIAQDAWIEPIDSTLPEVNYIDADGKVNTLKDYRRLSTRLDMANDILDSGWYVVDKDVKFENRPTIQGEVNLLLFDGVTLNMVHGIRNREGQTLNIYAQSTGDRMGKLICGSYENQAGIGGNNEENNGAINIYGGNIYAKSESNGAGIGGGSQGNGGTIAINGGNIEAHGHLAIGHGKNSQGDESITLTGVGVKDFNYEDRYYVLAIAQDAWIEPMDSTLPEVSYINARGEVKTLSDYRRLSTRPDVTNDMFTSGWYVVDKDLTFENRPTIQGEVNLLLTDGVTLNMVHGIRNFEGQTLNIYAQSTGENMGKLIAGSYEHQAGIGGNENENNGTINIYGGNIYAKSAGEGAGIGGGDSGNGGEINIYDGNIEAIADFQGNPFKKGVGAGIGGGDCGDGGIVRIYSGTVKATANHAKSFWFDIWGAGIGSGDGGSGGTIEIYGGEIEAEGFHAIGAGKSAKSLAKITLADSVIGSV